MKRTHVAIGIIGIAITLAAEPVCRVVLLHFKPPQIATHKLDHKPTQKTTDAWKAWWIAHTLKELDLACPPVDLAAIDTGDFIPAEVAPAWEPVEFEPDVTVAALDVPEAGNPTLGYVLTPPFAPYAAAVPTPEPWPLGLVLVGASCLYFKKFVSEQER